jgi:ribosomal protein S18 acetylase RimI-like enzyme
MKPPRAERERAMRFVRTLDQQVALRTEPFEYGTALFHEHLPDVWDLNYLSVEASAGEIDPDRLLSEAERLQGGAGLAHRKLVFEDEAAGNELSPLVASAGWLVERLPVLVFEGDPPGSPDPDVGWIELDAVREVQDALLRGPPVNGEGRVVRQIREALAGFGATGERLLGRFADGAVVSYCRVRSQGDVAQIEEIATLPQAREQGHATALVSTALGLVAAEHALVFLVAANERWIVDWYRRLGLGPVGHRHELTRPGP